MNTLDAQARANLVTSNGPWQYIVVFGVLTLGIALGAVLGGSTSEPKVTPPPVASLPVTTVSISPADTSKATASSTSGGTASAPSDNGQLYSVRQVFEQRGWNVTWDDPKQEVICRSKTGSVAIIDLEKHTATVDGNSIGSVKGLVVRNGQLYGVSEFLEKATEGSFHPGAQRGR